MRRKSWIWSYLSIKFLIENFISCAWRFYWPDRSCIFVNFTEKFSFNSVYTNLRFDASLWRDRKTIQIRRFSYPFTEITRTIIRPYDSSWKNTNIKRLCGFSQVAISYYSWSADSDTDFFEDCNQTSNWLNMTLSITFTFLSFLVN